MLPLCVRIACALTVSLAAATAHAQQANVSAEGQRAALNLDRTSVAQHQLEENAANQRAHEEAERTRLASIQKEQVAYALHHGANEGGKPCPHEHHRRQSIQRSF